MIELIKNKLIFISRWDSFLWLVQRISSVFILGFILLHFHYVVGKFFSSGGVTYADMKAVLSQPVYKISTMLFFFFAITHGLIGLRALTNEFIYRKRVQAIIINSAIAGGFLVCTGITLALLML